MEMRIAGPKDVVNGVITELGITDVEVSAGHTTIDVPEQVSAEQAQEVWNRLSAKGFKGYQETGEGKEALGRGAALDTEEDVVVVPPMAGGCR